MSAGKIIPGTLPLDAPRRLGSGRGVPGGLRAPERYIQGDLETNTGEILESRFYQDFLAKFKGGKRLDMEAMIRQIMFNSEIDILLKTLNSAFLPRVITVTTTPTEVIPRARSRYPRGYILLNPAEISGITSTVTFFASASRAAGTYNSSAFNVSGVDTVRAFLDVTVQGAGATLTVAAQSQDPLTSNWATTQNDIFSGNAAVGTYYANIGTLGVDRNIRLQAVVGVNPITFSISGLLKGGSTTPVGSTIFIGDRNVNTTIGYRLLPTQKEAFFLRENVEIWAVTSLNDQNLMVFELQ